MTEIIQKAIEKIDAEAEKLGGGQFMIIASHIIDNYLTAESNAQKVLNEKKTLSDCMKKCSNKARAEAQSGFAIIDDETLYGWVKDYYGFENGDNATSKRVNLFDVL